MSWFVWTGRTLNHFSVSRFTGVDGRPILWKKCVFKNWISEVSCGQSFTAYISKLLLMYQKMTRCWTKRNWKFPQISEAPEKKWSLVCICSQTALKPRWVSVQWFLEFLLSQWCVCYDLVPVQRIKEDSARYYANSPKISGMLILNNLSCNLPRVFVEWLTWPNSLRFLLNEIETFEMILGILCELILVRNYRTRSVTYEDFHVQQVRNESGKISFSCNLICRRSTSQISPALSFIWTPSLVRDHLSKIPKFSKSYPPAPWN